MDSEALNAIENLIGYSFTNKTLLNQAFTRNSYTDENPDVENYEVMEFLGDKVLSYILAKEYSDNFGSIDDDNQFVSKESEGYLTKRHIDLTRGSNLSRIAFQFGLTDFVKKSQTDKIQEKNAGDLIEAILGAVAIDSNWNTDALTTVVNSLVHPEENFAIRYTAETYSEKLEKICNENHFSINNLIINEVNNSFISKISISKTDDIQVFRQKAKTKKGAIEGISRQAYIHIKMFWLYEPVEYQILSPVSQLLFLEQKKKIRMVSNKFYTKTTDSNVKKWICTYTVIDNNEKFHTSTGESDSLKSSQKLAAGNILPEIMETTKPDINKGKGILWLIENKYKHMI